MIYFLLLIGLVTLVFAIQLGRKWHIVRAYKILTGKSEQEEMMAIREREMKDSLLTDTEKLNKVRGNKKDTSGVTAITLNEKTESTSQENLVDEDVFVEARRKHMEKLRKSQESETHWKNSNTSDGATGVLIPDDFEDDEDLNVSENTLNSENLTPEQSIELKDKENKPQKVESESFYYEEEIEPIEDVKTSDETDNERMFQTTILAGTDVDLSEPNEFNIEKVKAEQDENATLYDSHGEATGVLLDEDELEDLNNSEDSNSTILVNELEILDRDVEVVKRLGAYKRLKETL